MKKLFKSALTAVLIIAASAVATKAATAPGVNGTSPIVIPSTLPFVGTNSIGSTNLNSYATWPSAIGSNIVALQASTLLIDVTNVTKITVGSAKELALEFVGTLAGGAASAAFNSNILVRLEYDDQSGALYDTTNGVASRTPSNLWTWTIPATLVAGTVTVDVSTNFTAIANLTANSVLPSTSHGNWYVWDITYNAVTNGAPYLTNYALYFNAK